MSPGKCGRIQARSRNPAIAQCCLVLLCCVAITPAGRLQLKRPLVTFDIESTGLNVARDRILEIAAIKLLPNGTVGITAFCAVKAALLSCWCTNLLYHCCGVCPWQSMQGKKCPAKHLPTPWQPEAMWQHDLQRTHAVTHLLCLIKLSVAWTASLSCLMTTYAQCQLPTGHTVCSVGANQGPTEAQPWHCHIR